ncbi:MAG: hypothetical protein HPY90_05515 [Syntrophothermus sp.]|uniref:hypothetical protein n=1 Tax=Syntrophothermus sp. TaxID=2736299 RepID=UPI00257D01B2|nr:hypothetical protein [Syntrophothermus sp.]NSW82722.1 hypothetical protein [Syntrophothermus sp.]
MLAIMSLSLGLLAFLIVYLIASRVKFRFGFQKPDISSWTMKLAKNQKRKNDASKPQLLGISGGVLAVFAISQGKATPGLLILGMLIGFGVAELYLYIQKYAVRAIRLRETALLYLLVELGLKANHNLPQSLRVAASMTPVLREHIERCLEKWSNPYEALEYLGAKINLPEADALISILMQVVETGPGRMQGAMAEGSRHLQNLRRALVRSQAAGRPLVFSVFRMLPLVGACGLIIGPLVVRLVTWFNQVLFYF